MADQTERSDPVWSALCEETRDRLTEQVIEAGRVAFAQRCDFMLGAVSLGGVPETDLAEVAFAGRSNVGKSSLVNALTGRKTLARTSNTPGRTQELNFFNLGNWLTLTDLPGYGYAKVSRGKVDAWEGLTRAYLAGRPQLRRVMLLIDGRHGLKPSDLDVMELMNETAVSYQIVLTKADKVKRDELRKIIDKTAGQIKTHVAAHPDIAVTSSAKGLGIPQLRAQLHLLALAS